LVISCHDQQTFRLDVNPQLECVETLASGYYTDPAMLNREKERIFRGTWQRAGTLSQSCGAAQGVKRTIADPETYFSFDVAGEPVVATRDNAGTLRAFSNVRRHRAGPIARGAGCKHALNCAYHGWTYTLGGRLIGTPELTASNSSIARTS
jgi:choline monooxygenase